MALVGLVVPALRFAYDYSWFVGFVVSFVAYYGMMAGDGMNRKPVDSYQFSVLSVHSAGKVFETLGGLAESNVVETMEPKSNPRVVIVGGGFGGLLAARTMARNPVQVTLIDRQNFHTFQPLLYQVATAGLSPGEIAAPIRWILRNRRNVEVLMAEVQDFDLSRKVVKLPDGEVAYDYLIVASGASHAYFGHDEWEPFAPGLKTIEDALEIRRRVLLAFELAERQAASGKEQVQLNFVVVGGGPTGVELAGTLAEIARRALANEFRSIDPRKTTDYIAGRWATSICPPIPKIFRAAPKSSCGGWEWRCIPRRW